MSALLGGKVRASRVRVLACRAGREKAALDALDEPVVVGRVTPSLKATNFNFSSLSEAV